MGGLQLHHLAELSRAFKKKLSVCLVTGSFVTYRNALLFGLATYWGEEMTLNEDCTLEPVASEAAFAVADLLGAGDADPVDLTMSSQAPGTTTDSSKATDDAPQAGKQDLTRKNLKRITKGPGPRGGPSSLPRRSRRCGGTRRNPARRRRRCGR